MCAYSTTSTSNGLTRLLTDSAQPNLYQQNAFRLLELPAECSLAEAGKRLKMLEIIAKTGAPLPPGPGRALPLPSAPDTFAVTAAMQRLQDPFTRLMDEFFWFWPLTPGENQSDEALAALRSGNLDQAVNSWNDRPLSDSAAGHNLAVLYHILALDLEQAGAERPLTDEEQKNLDQYWRQSFRRWSSLLTTEAFWRRLEDRVRAIGDLRLRPEAVSELRNSIARTLLLINARLAGTAADKGDYATTRRHVRLMNESTFDQSAILDSLHEAVDSLRDRLKTFVANAKKETEQDPIHANKAVERMINLSTPVLSAVDQLLPVDSAAREACHDDVALGGLECLIAYGNRTEDWKGAMTLVSRIRPLVYSDSGRQRVEENIKQLEENAKSGNDWCAPGYFDLPAELLTPLEQAHDLSRQRNWDAALRILNDLAARPLSAAQLRMVNKPIAYCINMRCNQDFKAAIDEMTAVPTVIQNISRRIDHKDPRFMQTASALASNDTQGAARRGQLYCMDCGTPVMEWVTFTYNDLKFLVCHNCSNRDDQERAARKSRFTSALTRIAADMLRARDLDPTNKTVEENIAEMRKIATDLNILVPGLTSTGTPAGRAPAPTPPARSTPAVSTPPSRSTPAVPVAPAVRPASPPTSRAPTYGQSVGSLLRLLATIVDAIFWFLAMGLLTMIIGSGNVSGSTATALVFAGGMFAYYTLCYVLGKRTLGEAIIKARVVSFNDNQWNAGRVFFRTLLFVAACAGTLAVPGAFVIVALALIAIIAFSKNHRSLADVIAGTWLVKS